MNSQYENEIREELEYLEEKKIRYGWAQADADKYRALKKQFGED